MASTSRSLLLEVVMFFQGFTRVKLRLISCFATYVGFRNIDRHPEPPCRCLDISSSSLQASITEHYNDQIRSLTRAGQEEHKELIATISKFRDEEQEHHDIGECRVMEERREYGRALDETLCCGKKDED